MLAADPDLVWGSVSYYSLTLFLKGRLLYSRRKGNGEGNIEGKGRRKDRDLHKSCSCGPDNVNQITRAAWQCVQNLSSVLE